MDQVMRLLHDKRSLEMAIDILMDGPTFICDQDASQEALAATRTKVMRWPDGGTSGGATGYQPKAQPATNIDDVRAICWEQWTYGVIGNQAYFDVSGCFWTSRVLRDETARTPYPSVEFSSDKSAKWLTHSALRWHLRLCEASIWWCKSKMHL